MNELLMRISNTFTFDITAEFFIRILASSICGALVGIERSKRLKGAGIRTHCLVACAAAVFMILSKYAFVDLVVDEIGTPFPGNRGADPARIAAQVVSGLGFLGAGVIFKNQNSIKGLTTAAGLWVTAAIGMSFGSGLYHIGLFTTLLLIIFQLSQFFIHKFSNIHSSNYVEKFVIVANKSENFHELLSQHFGKKILITDISINRNDNSTITCFMTVHSPIKLETSSLLYSLSERDNIVSVSVSGD